MFWSIFLYIYLKIYQFYCFLWKHIFKKIGTFTILYFIDQDNIKNITINYYLGFSLDKFKNGSFYAKIYNENDFNHIVYKGDILQLEKIKTINTPYKSFKRKKFLLTHNDSPMHIDLNILDNYKKNMDYFDSSETNLGKILFIMGYKCNKIIIIQTNPIVKTIKNVDEVEIDNLYY
jgi:hypothetical protein